VLLPGWLFPKSSRFKIPGTHKDYIDNYFYTESRILPHIFLYCMCIHPYRYMHRLFIIFPDSIFSKIAKRLNFQMTMFHLQKYTAFPAQTSRTTTQCAAWWNNIPDFPVGIPYTMLYNCWLLCFSILVS
jgi:hypothetical protein